MPLFDRVELGLDPASRGGGEARPGLRVLDEPTELVGECVNIPLGREQAADAVFEDLRDVAVQCADHRHSGSCHLNHGDGCASFRVAIRRRDAGRKEYVTRGGGLEQPGVGLKSEHANSRIEPGSPDCIENPGLFALVNWLRVRIAYQANLHLYPSRNATDRLDRVRQPLLFSKGTREQESKGRPGPPDARRELYSVDVDPKMVDLYLFRGAAQSLERAGHEWALA